MGKWMDLAAKLEAGTDIWDNRDDRDNSRPNVPNVPNVPLLLPPDVASGLALLDAMPAPKLLDASAWPVVVRDALRLVDQGWAATALALGWSSLDLFGAVGARDGDPDGNGLAVWLAGRDVLAICATFASVADGDCRVFFNRRDRTGACLLWELGR